MAGTVGFVGLGAMGGPMAQNLLKHGFSLVVHDVDPTKAALWRGRGAAVVGSAADAAAGADRTICMVETTAQAEEVIAGERGAMHTARPGHVVICMSTVDPLAVRRLGERLAARGIAMLDAPVSGGTERALSGELSIIVGGAAATVAACRGYLPGHGDAHLPRGRSRAGARDEARQQHAEPGEHGRGRGGARAGREGGARSARDLRRGAGQHRQQLGVRGPRAAHPRARVRAGRHDGHIAFKDQELETAFAKQLGVPVLLANVSQQVYQMARAAGLNKEDGCRGDQGARAGLAGVRVGGEA